MDMTPKVTLSEGPRDGKTEIYIRASPRSGTMYLCALLREIGIDAKHESIGKTVTVNSFHREEIQYKKLIHLVRNPKKTIPSLTSLDKTWIEKMGFYAGFSPLAMRSLEGNAAFWCKWNDEITDSKPDAILRIEDIQCWWPDLVEMAGKPAHTAIPEVPKIKLNERENQWKNQQELPFSSFGRWAEKVSELSETFGYE